MALTANNYVIDKLRRVTEVGLDDNLVNWTGTSVENPQIEFTGESTEKTDAQGTLIAKFDTAKGCTFSGELSVISMPLMASQLGADLEIASDTTIVSGEDFEILTVETDSEGNNTVTLSYTPSSTPEYVYPLTEDKNIDSTNIIAIGTGTDEASIDGTVITLPSDIDATQVGVLYEYTTTSAVKISDGAENYAVEAKYIVDFLATDLCDSSVKRAGTIVFPKAKIDNNFTLDLTTEGTHPFSFTALKDYCSDDVELCYIIFRE